MYQKHTKRQLQAQATRKKIFRAACELFSDKGFNNVTVEEIAAAADVSIGAYYHHFSSKYEVMALWHESLDEQYLTYYNDVTCSSELAGRPVAERLEDFVIHVIEACIKLGLDYVRVVYSYMLTNVDFGNSMISSDRNYFEIIYDLIDEGQKNGDIRSDMDKRQIESDITIICRGCITDWCINGGSSNIVEHCHSVVHNYLNSLRT